MLSVTRKLFSLKNKEYLSSIPLITTQSIKAGNTMPLAENLFYSLMAQHGNKSEQSKKESLKYKQGRTSGEIKKH